MRKCENATAPKCKKIAKIYKQQQAKEYAILPNGEYRHVVAFIRHHGLPFITIHYSGRVKGPTS
jgi:hypothetical protein